MARTLPLIGRVTDLGDRLRRFTEEVSQAINGLTITGQIRQLANGQIVIRAGSFARPVPPGAGDDIAQQYQPGNLWVDTVGGDAYICISNAASAAIWKKIS